MFLLGLVSNARAFPKLLARFTASAEGQALLRDRPAIDGKRVEELRTMPVGTLGRAYADYLDSNGLDADLFKAPPGLPPEASYLSQRMRQTHDIWHVLTGYRPDVPGEIALQAFTFAQTDMPSAAMIAIGGSLRTLRTVRGIVPMAIDGYRRGRKASFLPNVRWEDHFARPIDDVRRDFGIEQAHVREVHATARELRAN